MAAYAPREKYIVADYDGANPFPEFIGLWHDANVTSGTNGGTSSFLNAAALSRHAFNGGANNFTMLPTILSPFVLRFTYNSSGLASTTTNNVTAGNWSGSSVRGWGGKIYEVLMINVESSLSVDAAIRSYLGRKWGISA
jgi:hypothetical protein